MLKLDQLKDGKIVKVLCKEIVYNNFHNKDGILFKKGELFIQRIDSNLVGFYTNKKDIFGYSIYDCIFHCGDIDYVQYEQCFE